MIAAGTRVKAPRLDAAEAVTRDEASSPTADACHDAAADGSSPSPKNQAGSRGGLGRFRGEPVLAYALIPGLALVLTVGAGCLKWVESSARASQRAAAESVRAATDSSEALLTYTPSSVEKDLSAARQRLTGRFRDSYAALTRDVIIPGSKQKQISAQASVRAVASVAATTEHAVVLLFVDQTVSVGNAPPTSTASNARVTLERIDGRWLISGYDPL